MRYVIGCLALIGLLVVLLVGGCFGVVAYGFSTLPTVPPGLTKAAVERDYASSLKLVAEAIAKDRSVSLKQDRLVLAVYRTSDTDGHGSDDRAFYLVDPVMTKGAHILHNGAGVAIMRSRAHEARCVAYELSVAQVEYLVVLLDQGLAAEPKPAR